MQHPNAYIRNEKRQKQTVNHSEASALNSNNFVFFIGFVGHTLSGLSATVESGGGSQKCSNAVPQIRHRWGLLVSCSSRVISEQ